MKDKQIDCRKCKFFYVTWDKTFPYGCKAMGFKTKEFPAVSVRVQSGEPCLMFNEKKANKKEEDRNGIYA